MSTVQTRNFPLLGATATQLTATASTQNVEIETDTEDIMIVNSTTSIVYVRTGNSNVVADLNAMPILPGEKGIYNRGNTGGGTTHLAYIATIASLPFSIIQGSGS